MPYLPGQGWGIICSNCKKYFDLGQQGSATHQQVGFITIGDDLTYPNGDFTAVEATCSHCSVRQTYPYDSLMRPREIIEREFSDEATVNKLKRDEVRISELGKQLALADQEKKLLQDQVKSRDLDIDKFADSYLTLAKAVAEWTRQQATQGHEKPKVNYEGANS